MSRIGKLPIAIPAGVTVSVSPENVVTVKGPKGELSQAVDPLISVSVEDGLCHVTRPNDEKEARSKHGLYRALINNMVVGVSEGYKKVLEQICLRCHVPQGTRRPVAQRADRHGRTHARSLESA